MLSRWFFHQVYLEKNHELIERTLSRMLCLGRIPRHEKPMHFSLSMSARRTTVLQINPEAWKLDSRSWWRSDIKTVAPKILRGERLRRAPQGPVFLLWSRDDTLLDPTWDVRVVSEVEARMEASCLWQWIVFVTRQPVSVQKEGSLADGFEKWLKERNLLSLPKPIRGD